jgi:nucleotide-binding universal stress UspA family protein
VHIDQTIVTQTIVTPTEQGSTQRIPSWRTRAMLESVASPRTLQSFTPQRPAAGPMIVAMAPQNGESVLRVARALTPSSPRGVLAVTARLPVPVAQFGGELGVVAAALEDERFAPELLQLTERVSAIAHSDSRRESRVLLGDPARVLADLARDTNAPLIVMGLGRHRPLDRLLGVETALRTIRQAPCPVLAVAHGSTAPMREVVIATDFSIRSARAAEAVLPLLAKDAVVHVLHVWDRSEQVRVATSAPYTDEHARYLRALPARFHRFTESLAIPPDVRVTHETRVGRPAAEILDFAEEVRADLIVAGRHGRGMLASMLAGSVTSALLRGAQCSVLVTPEPSFADVDRLSRLLTGASESSDPVEWTVQLDAFSRRNSGRPTVVEEDDYRLGAQVLERGYRLLGAAYDPHDRQVEVMLGGPNTDEAYVTHHIGEVDFLTVATSPEGRDIGLSVQHGRGQTLLTFTAD